MKPTAAQDAARREELAAFLLARREALQPEDLGIPRTGRRRVKGLRRYEVAAAAAVSETWYTWLEQGRVIRTTPQVIDSLARALMLDADGHRHLRRLAGVPLTSSDVPLDGVDKALAFLVDDLMPHPAHLMSPTTDLLAWNRSYACLFADPERLVPEHRNGVWIQVMSDEVRHLLVEWEEETKLAIGRLRAEASKYPGDPKFAQLVDDLSANSEYFRKVWASQEVHSFSGHVEHFDHPEVGTITARLIQLRPLDHSHLTLMIHHLDDDSSKQAMGRLLETGRGTRT